MLNRNGSSLESESKSVATCWDVSHSLAVMATTEELSLAKSESESIAAFKSSCAVWVASSDSDSLMLFVLARGPVIPADL